MSQLVPITFDGDEIYCVRMDTGSIWVSVRRICEVIGLDHKAQRERLQQTAWVIGGFVSLRANNGLCYDTYCIDVECLPMWLATINAHRVSPWVKEKLERYQRECARVLWNYFFGRSTAMAEHPWSVRFSRTTAPHLCFVSQNYPAGSWTVVTAAAVHMLILEDEIIRHMMDPSIDDRPDISVGLCWSHERVRRGFGAAIGYAPLTLPGRNELVDVLVYPVEERAAFEDWFTSVYLATKLYPYLERKPEFGKLHGKLPCASTATHTCRRLTGRDAVLRPRQHQQLALAGGFFPAGRALPTAPTPSLFPTE